MCALPISGKGVVLIEQVGVLAQVEQVRLDEIPSQPGIGDDVVEVFEQVVFGHGRQTRHRVLGDRCRVET